MSADRDPPPILDDEGRRIWHQFIAARARESAAKRALKALQSAMRHNSRPGYPSDPTITARYDAARVEVAEAAEERRLVTQAYHAHVRRLVAAKQRQQSMPPQMRAKDNGA